MEINSFKFKRNIPIIFLISCSLSSFSVEAGIFGKGFKKIKDVVDKAGDYVIDETGKVGVTIKETGDKINEAGDIIYSTGDVLSQAAIDTYVNTKLIIDSTSGLKKISIPIESSTEFTTSLAKGEWQDITSAIKDESILISLGNGASLIDIKRGLEEFDSAIDKGMAGSSKLALNAIEASQLGTGIKFIRNNLSQCIGSNSAVEGCFNDFISQFVKYYKLILQYAEKVNVLKSYAKGDGYEKITNKIKAIQKKSLKYFLPVLENSPDQLTSLNSDNSFAQNNEIHSNFEEYYSISDIRDALEPTEYSYHLNPQKACGRVSIPIVCDDFVRLDNLAINRFNYQKEGLSGSTISHRKQAFQILGNKSFGESFTDTKNGSHSTDDKSEVLDYLQSQLFADVNWSHTLDSRIPYIVKDEVLGGAGGSFIASDNDAIILLNEELFSDDEGLDVGFSNDDVYLGRLVALEEIGHWLNWRRCQFTNNMSHCANEAETVGDPGAKFANAAFINYDDLADFETQVSQLSEGPWSQVAQLTLASGITATYEGNPSLVDIQTALAGIDAKVRFRMRIQMGTPSSAIGNANAGSSGILEVNYTPPKRIKAGVLSSSDRRKYGYHDDLNKNLYLGNIGISFAIENFIGGGASNPYLGPLFPNVYGELGVKSSFGISIPLLKDSVSANNLANVNTNYRDDKMSLSYSVSPYAFAYLGLLSLGDTFKVSLDSTSALWVGNTVSWKANTIPFSIMMAGITIASSGVGCAKGAMIFSTVATISNEMKCALGAQVASGLLVTGTGYLATQFNDNLAVEQGVGWVNGIRLKVANSTTGIAAETRFEALFSKFNMNPNGLKAFNGKMKEDDSFKSNVATDVPDHENPLYDPLPIEPIESIGPYDGGSFNPGEFTLLAGESITTAKRHLVLQYDGNLVLYAYNNGTIGEALWESGTEYGARVHFNEYGNLYIFNTWGHPLWETYTNDGGGIRMEFNDAGNLAIYSEVGLMVWESSDTFYRPFYSQRAWNDYWNKHNNQ